MAARKPTAGRPKRTFTSPPDPRPASRLRPALPKPTLPARSNKPNPSRTNRSMNALDKAISEGKTLPSKNKRYPGDTDIKTGPSKGKPIINLKTKKK